MNEHWIDFVKKEKDLTFTGIKVSLNVHIKYLTDRLLINVKNTYI